jgi:hypothetical protein
MLCQHYIASSHILQPKADSVQNFEGVSSLHNDAEHYMSIQNVFDSVKHTSSIYMLVGNSNISD